MKRFMTGNVVTGVSSDPVRYRRAIDLLVVAGVINDSDGVIVISLVRAGGQKLGEFAEIDSDSFNTTQMGSIDIPVYLKQLASEHRSSGKLIDVSRAVDNFRYGVYVVDKPITSVGNKHYIDGIPLLSNNICRRYISCMSLCCSSLTLPSS